MSLARWRVAQLCPTIVTINRQSNHDALSWDVARLALKDRVLTQTVKTKDCIIPKNMVALETWLAELRRTTPLSAMGVALLALQLAELENRCVAMRLRMEQKADPEQARKRPLRSAA